MSTLTADDLIERGIAAFRGGDRHAAATLLYQATQEDPASQRAWLWLAGAVPGTEGRRVCLERVVAIAPTSPLAAQAKAGLAQLEAEATPAPTTASDPCPVILESGTLNSEPRPEQTLPHLTVLPIVASPEPPVQASIPQPEPATAPVVALSTASAHPLPPQTSAAQTLPAPRPTRALQDSRGPWVDIVVMVLLCAGLGWFIGRGAFPEFWAIALITSVVLFGLPSAIIHHGKGRSAVLGFLVGSGLGLIGLLIVAVSRPDQRRLETDQLASGEVRRCPACDEMVRREAKVCRFCQRDLPIVTGPKPRRAARAGRAALLIGAVGAVLILLLLMPIGAAIVPPPSEIEIRATIISGLSE